MVYTSEFRELLKDQDSPRTDNGAVSKLSSSTPDGQNNAIFYQQGCN